jgi:hypothetical protein
MTWFGSTQLARTFTVIKRSFSSTGRNGKPSDNNRKSERRTEGKSDSRSVTQEW